MKRSAALMMAALSFVALGNVASAAEEEPDRMAADTRLILETDSIVADQSTNDEAQAVEVPSAPRAESTRGGNLNKSCI